MGMMENHTAATKFAKAVIEFELTKKEQLEVAIKIVKEGVSSAKILSTVRYFVMQNQKNKKEKEWVKSFEGKISDISRKVEDARIEVYTLLEFVNENPDIYVRQSSIMTSFLHKINRAKELYVKFLNKTKS